MKSCVKFLCCTVVLLLLPALPAHAETGCRALFRQLTLLEHAYTFAEDRTPDFQEFWNLYKNNDNFAGWFARRKTSYLSTRSPSQIVADYQAVSNQSFPSPVSKTLDLNWPLVRMVDCCSTPQSKIIARAHGYKDNRQISQYERELISLRKGDQTRAGKKRFELGDFLGAGNATHVFAEAGTDEFALRLAAVPLNEANLPDGDRVATARAYLRDYVRNEKYIRVPHVKIDYVSPNFNLARVTRVFGTESAQTFLWSRFEKAFQVEGRYSIKKAVTAPWKMLEAQGKDSELHRRAFEFYESQNITLPRENRHAVEYALGNKFLRQEFGRFATPEEQLKLEKLWKFADTVPVKEPGIDYILPAVRLRPASRIECRDSKCWPTFLNLRQIIFDQRTEEWILVDWDGEDAYIFGTAPIFAE